VTPQGSESFIGKQRLAFIIIGVVFGNGEKKVELASESLWLFNCDSKDIYCEAG